MATLQDLIKKNSPICGLQEIKKTVLWPTTTMKVVIHISRVEVEE